MPCQLITKGRKLACKDARVGIKMVAFAPYVDTTWTTTLNEVTAIPVAITKVFPYEVKSAGNSLIETATVNADNRTTEIKAVLSLSLQKLGKESEVELQALLYSRVLAFVYDYNGNVHVVGIDTGLDATTGVKSTDTNGYTVTLEAMDKVYCPYLSTTAITALKALYDTNFVTP
jgi:hypothetical protein